jgi:hypothetical protein
MIPKVVHTLFHTRRELVDTLTRPKLQFVDKSVDPLA